MTQTAPRTMDAVALTGGSLTVTTAPTPTLGPGEVFVKVLATAATRSPGAFEPRANHDQDTKIIVFPSMR